MARFEQVLEALRAHYISDNFKLDEEATARALNYFRDRAAGKPEPENDPEWDAALKFVYDHGQSLDWVYDGNPLVMICKLASYSVAAGGVGRVA